MDALWKIKISVRRGRIYCHLLPCILLFDVLNGNTASLSAATFEAISADAIAANSPYHWHNPAIEATALSGDGRTIAGHIHDPSVSYDCDRSMCGLTPFVWSLGNGPHNSHLIKPTPLNSDQGRHDAYPVFATALNYVGDRALVISEHGHYESAIYTNGEPHLLRQRVTLHENLLAIAMSADGNVVAGNLGRRPFRWDQVNGIEVIEGLPEPFFFTSASISADGREVLLNAEPAFIPGPAYRSQRGNSYIWDAELGPRELPPIDGDMYSHGTAMSANGQIVVGSSIKITPDRIHSSRAARWEDATASQLELLDGYHISQAHDVSADGASIVGQARVNAGPAPEIFSRLMLWADQYPVDPTSRAVIWNAAGEVFDLRHLLESQFSLAPQLEGWTLTSAQHISDDGRVIIGRGIDPAGETSAWVAILPIPEPSAASLLLTGGMIAFATLMHRSRHGQI